MRILVKISVLMMFVTTWPSCKSTSRGQSSTSETLSSNTAANPEDVTVTCEEVGTFASRFLYHAKIVKHPLVHNPAENWVDVSDIIIDGPVADQKPYQIKIDICNSDGSRDDYLICYKIVKAGENDATPTLYSFEFSKQNAPASAKPRFFATFSRQTLQSDNISKRVILRTFQCERTAI